MDLISITSISGFVVGVLIGMTGIGGGALMTPILILLVGVVPSSAVATDLLFAAITKMVGMAVHGAHGAVDWQVVRRLAFGSLPAAAFTGMLLFAEGQISKGANQIILPALGGILLLTSVGMLLKTYLHEMGRRFRLGAAERFKYLQTPLTVVAGALIGCVVTLTSVGAGAFGAVILLYLYPLRMTPQKLVGTDIAHAIPLALVAGAGHFLLGNVDFSLLGNLLIGSIPGVILGSLMTNFAPSGVVRAGVAVALAASGLKILGI